MDQRRDLIAQWAFDTRPILGRFHLWLEDVEEVSTGDPSFVGGPLERAFVMAAAVTSLGTRLFGRFGEARDADKATLNRIKKDADAISAYAMSEALWYLTRSLPENHAVMVSLGEGLMPKAGETPEMGSNPLLGFGRVYARPEVALRLDHLVHRLLNERGFGWEGFWRTIESAGITVWGAAIDTLENTSRFAKGEPSGPMTILHVFDQPLVVASPYEGYVGTLVVPRDVAEHAAEASILLSYHSPRSVVLDAICAAYPEVPPERVHVWTLGGPSREERLGTLWDEWNGLDVHLVEDGWCFPDQPGLPVFIDSGTYAPIARVGPFTDGEGRRHVFVCDGYAASAEAIQAASLDPVYGTASALCLFSSRFTTSWDRERRLAGLDPESQTFATDLVDRIGELPETEVALYRDALRSAREAGMPVDQARVSIDDFFPKKSWRVLAVAGYMVADPYTGNPGVEQIDQATYRVTVRAATKARLAETTLTLRLMEPFDQSRLVFSPLLDRFYAGQDYQMRPVKVSDSGRIRNELQTLCSGGLEYLEDDRIRLHFDRIDDSVMPADKQALIREVLEWYQAKHPIWFHWLEIA